jgi:hypothetical protein
VATFGTTIGSGGFRFYDANHEVSYNYVQGVYGGSFQGPLLLDTGDAEGSSTNLAGHWRVVNALVERNVLVGNPEGIRIGDNYDLAPTGCTIRDNIVAQAATGVAVTQLIAPVSSTLTNNTYYATPATGGLAQGSDGIWRKPGYGPRLTFLQAGDVGPNGDPNDADGTGVLVSGAGGGGTVDDGTAAAKLGWGAPLGSSDEFEYTGAPVSAKWGVYNGPGHDGNGVRSPARVTVANGKMVLTGLANGDSAGLEHRFDQQYGRWEVRCRSFVNATSNGNDYHPVLIIWPTSGNWPEDGEYDFLENGTPGAQTAESYIHYPHPANVSVQQEHFTKSGVDLSQFHNFAIEWTPNGITTWIDGVQWFTVSGGGGPNGRSDIQDMPSGHLTVQLDNFDGTNQTPATFEVEWVRVYSLTPSGGTAGPQTVTAVGIPSAQAFGVPFVTGGNPARPPGSVDTLLGVNSVLGTATLGYTAGGGTTPPPGNQTVSGAGGIPSAQAFGVPVVTQADGPQTVNAIGIATAEAFGRPHINPGAPITPPAPGGVLVPTLFAVARDGVTLSPLPRWTSIKLSPVRDSAGALEITYPAGAPGFDLLHDNVSAVPLRALEIRVWLGGSQEGALGGWLVQKSGDDLTPGSEWTFSGHFHEWLLQKAIIAPQAIDEVNKDGSLIFAGATTGTIFTTMMDQAQARGALPLMTRDFTAATDSSGQPWTNAISSLKLAPKTTLYDVATKLVELGMCEFEVTPGRIWRAYNAGGRGVDHTTTTSSPLTFAHARNLAEHSRRESVRDAGTAVLVAGAEGFYEFASSATAQASLGWRAEVGVDAGQLNTKTAVQAVAPSYLQRAAAGTAEYAAAVEFGPGAPIPVIDYAVGDWAYTVAGSGVTGPERRRLRIAQIELVFGRDKPIGGKVVFNDLITDRLTALYRRLNAISTGSAVVGTSAATPTGAGADTIPPAAPQGLTVASSFAFQVPGDATTRAEVRAGWAAVTNDAYASQEVADKVRAAQYIAEWLRAGRSVSEADWTWSGCPPLVTQYGKAIHDEWKASPGGVDDLLGRTLAEVVLPWLEDYPAAQAGGGAIATDVERYRVQYSYLGSVQVNGVPRLPGTRDSDLGWVEADNSPTTATFLVFDTQGGRSIGVRVAAVDRAGNQGPWSATVSVVTAVDDVPPPVPSKPIAVPWFETMNVTWDGKGSAGEDMFAAASDFAGGGMIEVHVAEGIDFTPDRPTSGGKVDLSASQTYKTNFMVAGTTTIADLTIGHTYFVRFVAVDRNGNASDPSETSDPVQPKQLVNIDIGPDAIRRVQIVDGEIVNAKIANLAVNDAKISDLSVGKITAGIMNANVIIGGRFETPLSTTGNQLQLDAGGLRMYRGGTVVGRWEVFDGSILVTGQYNSAVTGQRVIINPGGGNPDTIRFYPSGSDQYSSIDSMDWNGGAIAGIRIVGSANPSTTFRGMVLVRDQYASLIHGKQDVSYVGSEMHVEEHFTRNKSAAVDLVIDERLTAIGGPPRVAMIYYDRSGFPINATGLYYKKTDFNGGEPQLYGNGQDVALIFGGGRLVVSNNPNGARRGIIAASFTVESSGEVKRNIRDLRDAAADDPGDDPILHLRRRKAKKFKLRADPDDRPDRLGFIAEEMPASVRDRTAFPRTDGGPDRVIEGLDYSAITALLWAATQRIDERLSAVEDELGGEAPSRPVIRRDKEPNA